MRNRESSPARAAGYWLAGCLLALHHRLAEPVRRNEAGTTAAEYALIVGLIAAAIITVVGLIGSKLGTSFSHVSASI